MEKEKTIDWQLTDKQALAFQYLQDKETVEVFFGGGAGGGKSALGAGWAIIMCLTYKGIRGAIAREELKALKESTLLTLLDFCRLWGLQDKIDYHYNANDSITFVRTGSVIYLKELKFYPSDPQYDYLGSMEYTFGFIDESPQITQKAKNVFRSRIRYRLKEYGLLPKLFMTGNPSKGWPYAEFYKATKTGKISDDKKFVQALVGDNPFIEESYIKSLQGLDKQTKERLLYGNWEYDDDPATLCEYDALLDMFSNKIVSRKDKYIIADIARFGDDRTVISYWEGWRCRKIAAYTKLPLVPDPKNPKLESSASKIKDWAEQFMVPQSHILVDEDGVGGGVKDYLGCKGFQGGRSPLRGENYLNLRSQCYFTVAKKINAREIAIDTSNATIKELLIEEFEQVKAKDRDKDKKLQVMPKDTVKEKIGRSPDFSDTIMMRCYFDLLPVPSIHFLTV